MQTAPTIPSDSSAAPVSDQGGSPSSLTVMVVTGEASGDVHAAHVVSALRKKNPEMSCFGMGSKHLRAAGMEIVVDSAVHGSVMGLTDVIAAMGGIVGAFRTLLAEAKRRRPDVVILLDFPDFNMLLAKRLKKFVPTIVYFIAPQVWAWRSGRAKTLGSICSKIIPIFPFEEEFYRTRGVAATWLGHPFTDHVQSKPDRTAFLSAHGLDPSRPVLALLPGSRKSEVERLASCMRDAYRRLNMGRPGIQVIVPVAPSLSEEWVAEQFALDDVVYVSENAQSVLSVADVAIVASGTATLEAAFCGTPFVIVYRVSALTYRIGRLLVKGTKYIGMPNIIAGKEIVPECIQEHCTPGIVAAEVEKLLADPAKREACKRELALVASELQFSSGESDSTTAERVADEILTLVASRSSQS